MSGNKLSKIVLTVTSLLLIMILGACADYKKEDVPSVTPEGAFTVDPLFREFYDLLGGEKVMGPAISPLFTYGNRKYQYIQAGCLEYDNGAPASQRFRLAPLGLDMGIKEPEIPAPSQSELVYVDGHIIYSGFVETYRKMGGARFVGKPLTEVHYNPEKLRFEQYFENLGFYWIENDPPDKISMLAYGAWKCDNHCRYVPGLNSIIDLPSLKMPAESQTFRDTVSRLGPDFTGFVLTDPYQTQDGKIEQIYENIVLVADPADPTSVSLRPVPIKLGILVEPATAAGPANGFAFWPTSGELGYNIPQPFLDYISSHGGPDVSGPPIGQLALTNDQIWRQCFRNLCLEYKLNSEVPAPYRIHPTPLGRSYRDLNYRAQGSTFSEEQTLQSVGVQAWELHQFISSDQNEEIGTYVYEGDTPLADIEPILVVILPDSTEKTYYFPPTGKDGKTSVKLDKIVAQNGTLIPYRVCVSNLTKDLYCVKDNFVIWYNP